MAIRTTIEALQSLGIGANTLTPEQRNSLDQNGFVIFQPPKGYWSDKDIDLEALRALVDELIEAEGWRGGFEGKEDVITPERTLDPGSNRLGNLLNKNSIFRKLALLPELVAAAHHVLRDEIKIGACDVREPKANNGWQSIHIDWFPRISESDSFDNVAAAIYLDPADSNNGVVRIIPGSHKILDWPDEHWDCSEDHPDEVQPVLNAGDIIVFNTNVWHGGAMNSDGRRRRAIYIDYRNRKWPQLLNQKAYLSENIKLALTDVEQYLLGVRADDPLQEEASYTSGGAFKEKYGHAM